MHFENCKSELLEIKAGIPEGSILGPLFFSILINDIVNSSKKFSFLMYAGDTTIYFKLEDFPGIHREHEINKELEKLNIWFQLNKLTLNVDKTKCMLFHKRRAVTPINISMNNMPIDIVPHFNYLGIVAIAVSTITITHLYIISIQIAIMSIVKPCLHITMK